MKLTQDCQEKIIAVWTRGITGSDTIRHYIAPIDVSELKNNQCSSQDYEIPADKIELLEYDYQLNAIEVILL